MHNTVFHFGPIIIRSYAAMLTIAFLVGTLLALKRAKKYEIPANEVVRIVNVIIIASLVGSRILGIIENFPKYSEDPKQIFCIWQGDFSYHGGLILAFISVFWWANRKNISFGCILDAFTPSIALGSCFVRIGCFLNGCCFGNPTTMPWGLIFPLNSPAGYIYQGIKIHPTQVYESLAGLASLFILLFVEKMFKPTDRDGKLFFSFLILTAISRFIVEFFRYQNPDLQKFGYLTEAQVFCIMFLIFSVLSLSIIYMKKTKSITTFSDAL